jgi:histidine phosphotransferase ChpT
MNKGLAMTKGSARSHGDPLSLRLAEAAVGRLCHDVIGSIGAVLNGLELATGSTSLAEEAMQLAADAAREVSARLRLARAVWNVDAPLDMADLSQLTDGLPNRLRLQLDLTELAEGVLNPGEGRLLLVTLMMAAEALHGRGTIVLTGDPASELVIVIAGIRAAWALTLPGLLADPQSSWFNLESRDLSTPLAVLLASQAGAQVSLMLATGPPTGPPPLMLTFQR